MELSKDRLEAIRDYDTCVTLDESEEMARRLLAAEEQQPVADIVEWNHPGEERACDVRLRRFDLKPGPLYLHPQQGNEFLPKNLDRALGVMGMSIPESREEFNFQQERYIQRLIDRVIKFSDELGSQQGKAVQMQVETSHSSVIAEQLAHILSCMDVTDHQRAVMNCAVDRLNKNAAMLTSEPVRNRDEFNSPVIPVPVNLLEDLRSAAHFEKSSYAASFGSHIDTGRWKDEYEELERVCKEIDRIMAAAPKPEVK